MTTSISSAGLTRTASVIYVVQPVVNNNTRSVGPMSSPNIIGLSYKTRIGVTEVGSITVGGPFGLKRTVGLRAGTRNI